MHHLYGVNFFGLRIANIFYEDTSFNANYSKVEGFWRDINIRQQDLWSYVDVRDVVQSINHCLVSNVKGAEVFNITSGDTIMKQTNEELIMTKFPSVPIDPDLGPHQTLISINKAKNFLGYKPAWSWRKILSYPNSI